jgi:hypothetical protein
VDYKCALPKYNINRIQFVELEAAEQESRVYKFCRELTVSPEIVEAIKIY